MSKSKTKNKKIEEELEQEVMEKIKTEEIKMKPKWYFWGGSILMFLGLSAGVFVSIFLLNLVLFALRAHGPMGQWRVDNIIANFPWWALLISIGSIVLSLILLKKYEFSYKNNFWGVLIVFMASILLAVFLIDYLNIDRLWQERGPMRGMYKRYEMMENGKFPGNGNGRMRDERFRNGNPPPFNNEFGPMPKPGDRPMFE